MWVNMKLYKYSGRRKYSYPRNLYHCNDDNYNLFNKAKILLWQYFLKEKMGCSLRFGYLVRKFQHEHIRIWQCQVRIISFFYEASNLKARNRSQKENYIQNHSKTKITFRSSHIYFLKYKLRIDGYRVWRLHCQSLESRPIYELGWQNLNFSHFKPQRS